MLADWARRYPSAEVATSDDGTLGAIAIRSKRTGKIVTIAVTYDRSYPYLANRDAPAHDQLLVGHTRGLLLPREEHPTKPGVWCCGDPQLVGSIILHNGAAIAVNPQERLVATLMSAAAARSARLIPLTTVAHPNVCIVDNLDSCRPDETGLVTPAASELRKWQSASQRDRNQHAKPDQRLAYPRGPQRATQGNRNTCVARRASTPSSASPCSSTCSSTSSPGAARWLFVATLMR